MDEIDLSKMTLEQARDILLEWVLHDEGMGDYEGEKQAAKNHKQHVLDELACNAPEHIKSIAGQERWARMQPEYRQAEAEEVEAMKACGNAKDLRAKQTQTSVVASQHLAEQKERDRI